MATHIIHYKPWLITALVLLAFGVALGAFGAHGLKSRVSPDMLDTFHTAVRYHLLHSLGILLLIAIGMQLSFIPLAGPMWLLLIGIMLFSGSLYLMTFTGWRWLGMITPLGGVSFIAGWLWATVAIWKGWT